MSQTFKKYISIIILFLITSCFAPINISSNNSSSITLPHRIIRISIDPAFSIFERDYINIALNNLSSSFNIETISSVNNHNQDLTIIRWSNNNCVQTNTYGRYYSRTNYIIFDPGCVCSKQQFVVGIQHEIGHWLGMKHICLSDRRTTDTCSSVGFGRAIMNPFTEIDANMEASELDLEEYRRTLRR